MGVQPYRIQVINYAAKPTLLGVVLRFFIFWITQAFNPRPRRVSFGVQAKRVSNRPRSASGACPENPTDHPQLIFDSRKLPLIQ
jgi:hypothetical protein